MAPYTTSELSLKQLEFLDHIASTFTTTDSHLEAIIKSLTLELAKESGADSQCDLYMNPSSINSTSSPCGTSLCVSIESTGKRVRVSSVTFASDSSVKSTKTKVFVTPVSSLSNMDSLFDYVTYCIRTFLQNNDLDHTPKDRPLPLGFTLGLPVSDNSCVAECSKEDSLAFNGKNVVRLLCDSIIRSHLPVRVTSVMNNTVGSLLAANYSDKSTRVAASFNHGVNAAFYKSHSGGLDSGDVAINTELGRFGTSTDVLPLTPWDRRIDRESSNPGHRIFEKMVADQYIGEIVRNLITDFMDMQLLFSHKCRAEAISTEYSFHTSYMGSIMDDCTADLAAVNALLETEFGIESTLADRQIIRSLCEIVAARASRLAGSAIAALVLFSKQPAQDPSVALSGALFDMNRTICQSTIDTLQEQLERFACSRACVRFQRRNSDLLGAAVNAVCN